MPNSLVDASLNLTLIFTLTFRLTLHCISRVHRAHFSHTLTKQAIPALPQPPNIHMGPPTLEGYFSLLRERARLAGLIDWHPLEKPLTTISPGLPSFDDFKLQYPRELTDEEFFSLELDPGNHFVDVHGGNQTLDVHKMDDMDGWERLEKIDTQLNSYKVLWVPRIREIVRERYLELGGKVKVLKRHEVDEPANHLLWWCAEMWKLEDLTKTEKERKVKKDNWAKMTLAEQAGYERKNFRGNAPELHPDYRLLQVTIFGDVPQEEMVQIKVHFKPTASLQEFHQLVVHLPVIRYFVHKRDPTLAAVLFIHDDLVYPPPQWMSLKEEVGGAPSRTEKHMPRADLVYDDGPGNGWWVHVVDLKKIQLKKLVACGNDPKDEDQEVNMGMVEQSKDWRPMDTEEVWESLKNLIKSADGNVKVYMRHKSVEERMEFVRRKRVEEEEETARWKGFRPTNLLLNRHMKELVKEGIFEKCLDAMREKISQDTPLAADEAGLNLGLDTFDEEN